MFISIKCALKINYSVENTEGPNILKTNRHLRFSTCQNRQEQRVIARRHDEAICKITSDEKLF
jgi:hypothetical protein